MTETWIKRLLIVAAAWNLLGGASALLDPAQHFAQMYSVSLSLDEPLQRFFYQCVWINVIAWGVGYLIAAFLPNARAALMAAGAAGKAAYCGASVALFASGVGHGAVLAAGMVDLGFAALFALALISQWRRTASPGSRTQLA